MRLRKHYVEVIVRFNTAGEKIPLFICWDDGKRFKVDRVLDRREAASRKVGGQGERYLCLINGGEHALFFEDPAWFVEEKAH